MPHGLLNLNKPTGMTSRRVVDLVERLARQSHPDPESGEMGNRPKAGHAGTLDPLATGVLVLCVGAATRLIENVQRMPKRYTATILLGRTSPTEDVDGEVVELDCPPLPSPAAIRAAASRFVGLIQQRPPAYSALKIAGRRAYDLARQGHDVQLQPRPITIYELEVLRYEYPELMIHVACSSGTYVRSLGRDLAECLGTAAVMSALVRTAIGPFRVEQAVDPRGLMDDTWTKHLQPMRLAVDGLPQLVVSAEEIVRLRKGQTIAGEIPATPCAAPGAAGQGASAQNSEAAALDAEGRLVAILRPRGAGLLGPARNLPES